MVRKFRATVMVVPAAVLLLAAACSGGSDAGRGAVPTTAPAVTATSATDAAAPATTGPTANVTDVLDDSTTPVATVTVTDTTPTGTTTPATDTTGGTTGTTSGPTGTTETVTSTTGSGPTVPTTLPITDDTTTPTTAATDDTDTDTEPRNKVDEQYPLGSAERKAYLETSGGVAPVGATVTFDGGDGGGRQSIAGYGQGSRTTADRWPNGYPAAPRSPDYSATTFAQRDAQRGARWVAAMERGGHFRWWVSGVPTDPNEPPVSEEIDALREYQTPERYNDLPPANLIWAPPRVEMCWSVSTTKSAKHVGTGVETLPCEVVLDWALWWVEEFTDPSVISLPWYDRMYTVAYRRAALMMGAFAQPPTDIDAVSLAVSSTESHLIYSSAITDAGSGVLSWVATPSDVNIRTKYEARLDAERDFLNEVRAGRRPWESVP